MDAKYNRYRDITPSHQFEGKEFYDLVDPYTGEELEDYFISKTGDILSIKRGKYTIIKPNTYGTVTLRTNNIGGENYNIGELVINTFMKEQYAREKYTFKGKVYKREYTLNSDWYIVPKDGEKRNTSLDNLDRLHWKEYKEFCKKFDFKPVFKPEDKALIKEIAETSTASTRQIAEYLDISQSMVTNSMQDSASSISGLLDLLGVGRI